MRGKVDHQRKDYDSKRLESKKDFLQNENYTRNLKVEAMENHWKDVTPRVTAFSVSGTDTFYLKSWVLLVFIERVCSSSKLVQIE